MKFREFVEAFEHFDLEKTKTLVSSGIDINFNPEINTSPSLISKVIYDYCQSPIPRRETDKVIKFISYWLDNGLVVSSEWQNTAGYSSAEHICNYCHSNRILEVFLQHGMNLNERNDEGETILDVIQFDEAVETDTNFREFYKKRAQLLKKYGAKTSEELSKTEKIKELLTNQFDFNFSNPIENKLLETAISGEGNELKKMLVKKDNSFVLNLSDSSSLCSFLSFSKTSKPILLQGRNNNILNFSDLAFEVENVVIYDDIGLSSMDVVLFGNRIALFLECKYKEYLKISNKSERSVSIKQSKTDTNPTHNYSFWYKKFFPEITNGEPFGISESECHKITENICWYRNADSIILAAKKGYKIYLHGIKQMISHFIGLINFCDGRKTKDSSLDINQFDKIYLSENLFDFEPEKDYEEKNILFKNYNESFGELAKVLQQQDNRIELLLNGYDENLNVFTYQNIFKSNQVSEAVRSQYKY